MHIRSACIRPIPRLATAHELTLHGIVPPQRFTGLADDVVEPVERQRFLAAVDALGQLDTGALGALKIEVDPRLLDKAPVLPPGIFR